MSLTPTAKTEVLRRPWSLAMILTSYYSLSAFLIVLLTVLCLQWSMTSKLNRKSDQSLVDRGRLLQTLIQELKSDISSLLNVIGRPPDVDLLPQYLIRVTDAAERTIAETPGMALSAPTQQFPPPSEFTAPEVRDIKSANRVLRLFAANVETGNSDQGVWRVQIALDRTQEEEVLRQYHANSRLALVLAFVACLGVGYWIAQRGMRPLRDVSFAAESIQVSNLNQRLETEGMPLEIQQMAQTFNQMLSRLERSFARLSQFSADIAHELRTPVNNLRGELDVVLDRKRSPDEYAETIGSALEECDRLTRLIESLLFLARAEHPETQIERSSCQLGRELHTIRDFFFDQAEEAGITILVEADESLETELNRPLFQRAIGNLVMNAITHTPDGGTIILRGLRQGQTALIEVQDTGCGIPEAHLPHLFERFYRVDPSRSQISGGVGLGLAIVKGVVELHSGAIHVISTPNVGTCFQLTIPAFSPVLTS
ncbi:MAG TPA: heavy metal sensor histidine kinase [Planctomicrobium sp.]|nr:heavy metal sensor histidine kinase [Planctomicrobium sp.]